MSNSKITYDANTLGVMKLFENITRAKIKDCIIDAEKITFVVLPGELKTGLGKNAANIKKLAEKFGKKIRIVEFKDSMLELIKSFINPLKVDAIHEEENVVILESTDTKTKGLIIGRAAKNLRALEENIKRYFPDLKEIKVV